MFQPVRRKSNQPKISSSRQNSRNKVAYHGFFTQEQQINQQMVIKSLSKDKIKSRKSHQINRKSNEFTVPHKVINPLQIKSLQKKLHTNVPTNSSKKIIKYTNINFNPNPSNSLKWKEKHTIKNINKQQSYNQWTHANVPYSPDETLFKFANLLTAYEKQQIMQFKKIYFIGHQVNITKKIQVEEKNFKNQQKQYLWIKKNHIAYRYQIVDNLGKGSYGEVLKVFDHFKKEYLALKIIKSKSKLNKQALIQYKILQYIKEHDSEDISNVVKIRDFLIFRKHVILVFELLSDNLYQLLARNNYEGLPIDLIRRIAIQIFTTLDFLKKNKIIHCDLKPQNILLKDPQKSGIKIIDFGSSCFIDETIYTYIQSRFYRAPQIFLGIPYDSRIDLWSTGCILAELYLGVPLFPGNNQFQQVKFIVNSIGIPPHHILTQGTRTKVFFNSFVEVNQKVKQAQLLQGFDRQIQLKIIDQDFKQLILGLLKWDPKQRITPSQALKSKWVVDGLPKQFKNADLLNRKNGSQIITKKNSKSKEKNNMGYNKRIIIK